MRRAGVLTSIFIGLVLAVYLVAYLFAFIPVEIRRYQVDHLKCQVTIIAYRKLELADQLYIDVSFNVNGKSIKLESIDSVDVLSDIEADRYAMRQDQNAITIFSTSNAIVLAKLTIRDGEIELYYRQR